MRLTQGTFSFLPDFTVDQITAQVQYCIDQGWPVSIEHTDDARPGLLERARTWRTQHERGDLPAASIG